MAKLRTLGPLVRALDTRTAKLPPRQRDPFYETPEFRAWRTQVVARADGQCEAMVNGHRCTNASPDHRMYADHVIEIRDGGARLDLTNGQCLCHTHHEIKSAAARAQRLKALI